jgi:alpha-tubulin suppressor-like RCC1 family protein
MYQYFDMHFLIITSNVTKTKLKERMENVRHNVQYLLDDVIFIRARISAGDYHSLALTEDGKVFGWGSNNYGQLNIPNNLPRIVDIACGNYHSLALSEDGKVFAWGNNKFGQLNVPEELMA